MLSAHLMKVMAFSKATPCYR